MNPITQEQVAALFAHLESGNADAFFRHVADDVDWTVMGTHPLAGTYHTKQEFIAHTFTRLNTVLKDGVMLRVTHILVSGNFAAVELEALSTALNGVPFRKPVLLDLPVRSRADCGSAGVS
ncbi:MAG: nuclear transport factor 2 family protein [Methanoregula sp.]|nr:nuclear transport factor 2 family protein [Methanoregula sp.]